MRRRLPELFAIVAVLLVLAICFLVSRPALAQNQGIGSSISDSAYGKSASLTVGVAGAKGFGTAPFTAPLRGVLINVTVAGNVTLQMLDGSTMTLVALPVGIYILPLQVVEVTTATATATYWQLG